MEPRTIETRHRRKDGTTYDVEVSLAKVELSGEFFLSAVHRDITNRKRKEEALRQSEMRFRAAIEASAIPYVLNDAQFNITFLNAAFVRTFGYTLDDIPTLEDWWSKAYPNPEYRQRIIATWLEHLEQAECDETPFEPVEAAIRRITSYNVCYTKLLRCCLTLCLFCLLARRDVEERHDVNVGH